MVLAHPRTIIGGEGEALLFAAASFSSWVEGVVRVESAQIASSGQRPIAGVMGISEVYNRHIQSSI